MKKSASAAKPEPKLRPAQAGARPPSAREVLSEAVGRASASHPTHPPRSPAESTAGSGANVIQMAPGKAAFEIESATSGLCAALENAALLFASGQSRAARQLLEQGVDSDAEARESMLAWLCLFDVLRRVGDKTSFDSHALQFVVQFERSAPGWEELGGPRPGQRPRATTGAIVLSGKLSASSAIQLKPLTAAAPDDHALRKLDLAGVTSFDDAGAQLLEGVLREARRRRVPLALVHPDALQSALMSAANQGREAGESAWLLLLEMLQWQGEQAAFDDRAVEYAVTFELSPPSWDPPTPAAREPAQKKVVRPRASLDETIAWSDEITGQAPPALVGLEEFVQLRNNAVLDLSLVDRIDFASAGALANALHRLEARGKKVQIAGASPIIRALLLLVGIGAELFTRKLA